MEWDGAEWMNGVMRLTAFRCATYLIDYLSRNEDR